MKYLIPLFIITILLLGCSEDVEIAPNESFVKIYDSNQFSSSFEPIDVIQTNDGGYIVLSGYRRDDTDFLGVYVMKADEFGNFVSGTAYPTEFVHPIDGLLRLQERVHFVSMNQTTLQAVLHELDDDGNLVNSTNLGTTYPLNVAQDGSTQFILASYDNDNKNSVLGIYSAQGGVLKESEFGIGAGPDVEEPIIDHFTRTGRELPFLAGKTSDGTYFMNGFYNYTLSVIFTQLNSNDPQGVLQGQQDEGGISNLVHLSGDQFATSRFNFGDNFLNAVATIDRNAVTSSTDLSGNPMLEWVEDTRVVISNVTVDGTEYTGYASTTKNQQIVINLYDRISGEYKSSEYLGFTNPYEIGAMKQTTDEGIIVLGKTQVAGRFSRICLFKISLEELRALTK